MKEQYGTQPVEYRLRKGKLAAKHDVSIGRKVMTTKRLAGQLQIGLKRQYSLT